MCFTGHVADAKFIVHYSLGGCKGSCLGEAGSEGSEECEEEERGHCSCSQASNSERRSIN
jgi:hypothetical protein